MASKQPQGTENDYLKDSRLIQIASKEEWVRATHYVEVPSNCTTFRQEFHAEERRCGVNVLVKGCQQCQRELHDLQIGASEGGVSP